MKKIILALCFIVSFIPFITYETADANDDLDYCLKKAYKDYQREWRDECNRLKEAYETFRNRYKDSESCLLPQSSARFHDDRHERTKQDCYRLYDR